uniref:Uncharacterized protein n=1 Tax=Rousettus aegyptiacus TaxID=9407 RepID=A0A7J8CIR3_ROUAE|nr:hypothetical protein HJG63_009191 [Rousettus aegyptiacus]
MDSVRSKAPGAVHSAGAGCRLGGRASCSSCASGACQDCSAVGPQGRRARRRWVGVPCTACLASGPGVCGDWCLGELGLGIWPVGRAEKGGMVKGGCRRVSLAWTMQLLLLGRQSWAGRSAGPGEGSRPFTSPPSCPPHGPLKGANLRRSGPTVHRAPLPLAALTFSLRGVPAP